MSMMPCEQWDTPEMLWIWLVLGERVGIILKGGQAEETPRD